MAERLERWSFFHVAFDLDAAEDVLECCVDRAASSRAREIVFPQMERIVKLCTHILVEVVNTRDVETTQVLLLAQNIVNRRTACVAGQVVEP